MPTPDLVNPALNNELENLQKHSKHLIGEIRRSREIVQVGLLFTRKNDVDVQENVEITKLVHAEIMKIVRDLDDTTKKLQGLIDIPKIESDKIGLDKLDVSKRTTNPNLPAESFGILARVPKVVVVGGLSIVLPSEKQSQKQGMYATEDDIAQKEISDGKKVLRGVGDAPSPEKPMETELSKLLAKLEAKAARLDRLKKENQIMKDAIDRLLAPNRRAIEKALHTGYPQDESEVDELIKDIDKEKEKIEKLIEKTESEIKNQQRANDLINRQRKFAKSPVKEEKEPVFDLDTELGLNKESLSYEETKRLYEKIRQQISNLEASIQDLSIENETCQQEYDQASEKYKLFQLLHEIMDEKLKAQKNLVDLQAVEEEIEKMENKLEDLNRQEDSQRDVLYMQDSELEKYGAAFLQAQEKYEENKIRILQREGELKKIAECARQEIANFREKMESKLDVYRALPFVVTATKTQCYYVGEKLKELHQYSTLLSKKLSFFKDKVEDLLRCKEQEKRRSDHFEAKQKKATQMRDMYDAKELRMNKLRQNIQDLNAEISEINIRTNHKTEEIETLQQTIEQLKDEYAQKLVNLRMDHENKKQAQLGILETLERQLAVERVRQKMHVVCNWKDV